MSDVVMEPFWEDHDPPHQPIKPGHWAFTFSGDHGAGQLGIYLWLGLGYKLQYVDEAIETLKDCMAGRRAPGWALGDNDGGVAYGGGYLLFASDYDDQSKVVIAADVFLGVLERLRAMITDPGFTDPNASFESMPVPIVATGPDAFEIYRSLGGSTDNP